MIEHWLQYRQDNCPACKGDGFRWLCPSGVNPFLAGGFNTARSLRRVDCHHSFLQEGLTSMKTLSELTMDDPEVWLPAPGWPGYEVSSHGRVKSLPRTVVRNDGALTPIKGRILKTIITDTTAQGTYFHAQVAMCLDGKSRKVGVSRLVCGAFHGPASEDKPHVLHNGQGSTVNCPSNMRWGTPLENAQERAAEGYDKRPRQRVAERARELIAKGWSDRKIARELGCVAGACRNLRARDAARAAREGGSHAEA
jgi:hypothetical protein